MLKRSQRDEAGVLVGGVYFSPHKTPSKGVGLLHFCGRLQNLPSKVCIMASNGKQIGISGSYAVDGNHVDNGDYNLMQPQSNDRNKSIPFLLKAMEAARDKSNAFITNEMDKEKNKSAPPAKRQRIDK